MRGKKKEVRNGRRRSSGLKIVDGKSNEEMNYENEKGRKWKKVLKGKKE